MNQLCKRKTASELALIHLNLSQYTEVERLGNQLANLLYFGDPWPIEDGQETFESLKPKFMAIFEPIFEELPSVLYVDRDFEYVSDKEPEFDSSYYETEDEGYKQCCCDHARQSYLDDMASFFYSHWTQVSRKEYLTEWLGKYCVETISYIHYV